MTRSRGRAVTRDEAVYGNDVVDKPRRARNTRNGKDYVESRAARADEDISQTGVGVAVTVKHDDGPIGGEDCEIDRQLGNSIESKTIPAVPHGYILAIPETVRVARRA